MPDSTPNVALRRRIETAIRVFEPPLNLMLAVGDRISYVLAPRDPDLVPARMPRDGEAAPRGLRER
jgi:hypothetical protein